jgi:hypothetical protein
MKAVKRADIRRSDTTSSSSSVSASLAPQAVVPVAAGRQINPISPPTSLELRGVPIHFPFKPYKCQEDYMGKVLDALLRSENALLESPTGTGNVLGVLAFRVCFL